jgi:alpha-L-rhamnosidase/acyl-CoA thioesterase-1
MLKAIPLIIGFMTSLAAAQATRPAAFVEKLNAGTPQKIVFYGTSLTHQGAWTKQVMAVLDAKYPKLITTFNGAQSGQQSRWGVQNVKGRVIEQKPTCFLMEWVPPNLVGKTLYFTPEAK